MVDFTLDPVEARLLGVLIEKELTTPEQYPLSINALNAGANQKSNRAPVLDLPESEVRAGIERLRRRMLVGVSHASGARVERYHHAASSVLEASPPELAVLAELMLRGAQTAGELRGRASRMSPLETLEDLARVLQSLESKGLARRLPPAAGSRAPSWEQSLAPAAARPSKAVAEAPAAPIAPTSSGLEARVAALEAEVARLARLYEQGIAGP